MPRSAGFCAIILALLFAPLDSRAGIVSIGLPATDVPPAVVDALATLTDPLPADEFLLPVHISGTSNLQEWNFDLLFDPTVVQPLDAGGFFQSVYPAHFNSTDSTASNITSGGFPFPSGSLTGIAGFSSGVSGDGILAFVLFTYQADRTSDEAQFAIANATLNEQKIPSPVPEPETLALALVAITAAFAGRRR